MKFGIRTPSISGRISARASWKRVVRNSLGLKAPRGFGWLTNPKKAAYNRVYSRTTVSADKLVGVGGILYLIGGAIASVLKFFSNREGNTAEVPGCPSCNAPMVLRNGRNGRFYGCANFPVCRQTKNV